MPERPLQRQRRALSRAAASAWRHVRANARQQRGCAAQKLRPPALRSPRIGSAHGARGVSHQREQGLESLAVGGIGVELMPSGKQSASMRESSCLPLAFCSVSRSVSLSICFVRLSIKASFLSCSGSRRQLSIRKNERQRGSDEPHAPLLLELDGAAGEGDVVIGGKQGDQGDHGAA